MSEFETSARLFKREPLAGSQHPIKKMANNVDTVTRDPEQLAAPIASLFGGVHVAGPQIKIDPSTIVVDANVLEAIETM